MKNPLETYYENSGMSWDKIAIEAEVSQPQLIRISKRTPYELQEMKISTALHILTNLKVDLLSYVVENVYPELIEIVTVNNEQT